MWHQARIAVIVPAYNEQRLLVPTVNALPDFVDSIHIVDDASSDDTVERASCLSDPRVRLLRHESNRGVGAAIVTGYQDALARSADVLVVMAGDGQMDPDDLPKVITPVASGAADYVKGNRFLHARVRDMPAARRVGGRMLSLLTRLATGLAIDDTQCGFTALGADAARRLALNTLWPRYGYPNDLLALAAAANLRVVEVPVRPVYADERSGIRPWHALTVAGVIARRWLQTRAVARPSGRGNQLDAMGADPTLPDVTSQRGPSSVT